MTQDKSREAFGKWYKNTGFICKADESPHNFDIVKEGKYSGHYRDQAIQISWEIWQASRADVLAMLESEDVVKYIAAMVNPDPNGGYMAHHLRTAKAVLAAVAEKVRGK